MCRSTLLGIIFFVLTITDPCPALSQAQPKEKPVPETQRPSGAATSKKSGQRKSLQLQIQSLQEQIASLRARLESASRAAEGREETLRELDELKAAIKRLSERVSATRARLADLERKESRLARTEGGEAPTGGWRMGYNRGFFWQSPAGRFGLKMNGYIIARYGMAMVGAVSEGSDALNPPGWPDRHGFQVMNTRFGVGGNLFSTTLRYKLRFEMAGTPRLRHALLSWHPFDFMRVTVGQMKVPDSGQYLQSKSKLQLADRSVATRSFASGYDQGLRVTFRHWGGKLFEQVGVFNGSPKNLPNENMALQYVLRVGTEPLGPMVRTEDDPGRSPDPRLRLAASVSYNKPTAGDLDGDGVTDEKHAVQMGGEAAFVWRGLSVSANFYYRLEDHTESVDDGCPQHYQDANRSCDRFQGFWGGFGQAGYYVWRRLQVAGRYAYTQIFDSRFEEGDGAFVRSYGSPQSLAGLTPEEVHEATGGVSYDLYRHNIRVGLYYSWYWERGYRIDDVLTDESRHLHWIRVQTRLVF